MSDKIYTFVELQLSNFYLIKYFLMRNFMIVLFSFSFISYSFSKVQDNTEAVKLSQTGSNIDKKPVKDTISKSNLSVSYSKDGSFSENWTVGSLKSFNNIGSKDTLLNLLPSGHTNFAMPFNNFLTSRYGPRGRHFHPGIDIELNTGDMVVAAFDGKIRYARYNNGGYGNLIIIRHYNGLETYYGHLSKIIVEENQYVKAGDLLGLGGSTGRSTGSHLHFECRYNGVHFNPEKVISWSEARLSATNVLVSGGRFYAINDLNDSVNHSLKAINDTKLENKTAYNKELNESKLAKINEKANNKSKDKKVHKVEKGENLFRIALNNGKKIEDICKLNNIKSDSKLAIGQEIILE